MTSTTIFCSGQDQTILFASLNFTQNSVSNSFISFDSIYNSDIKFEEYVFFLADNSSYNFFFNPFYKLHY